MAKINICFKKGVIMTFNSKAQACKIGFHMNHASNINKVKCFLQNEI